MEIYNRHVDTVYRVCFSFMKSAADTEDMVQETFLKLISCKKKFTSKEHEADVEWQEFLEGYDQDESILAAVGNSSTGFEEKLEKLAEAFDFSVIP